MLHKNKKGFEMEEELTAREFLNNMLMDGMTFQDIRDDKLIWILNEGSGSLTNQLYYELEQEYIRRLHHVKQ